MSFPLYKIEFAQLRTPRGLVPYVLSCTWCVMSPVPRAPCALVLNVPLVLPVLVPYLPCALGTLECLVPRALRALMTHVPLVLRA